MYDTQFFTEDSVAYKFFVNPTGGVVISQSWIQLAAIFDFIETNHIKIFFELGLNEGGIGSVLYLRCHHVPGFEYIGIERNQDIVDRVYQDLIFKTPNAYLVFSDIFTSGVDLVKRVLSDDNRSRTALIFCDGGDKPRELRTFAPLLRPGDFIMAHDYSTSPNAEVQDKDLQFLVEDSSFKEIPNYRSWYRLPVFQKI